MVDKTINRGPKELRKAGFENPGEAFDVATDLLSKENTLSPTRNAAKLMFKTAERRLRDSGDFTPDQMDEVLSEVSSKLESNIVNNADDWARQDYADTNRYDKSRASFNEWSAQKRSQLSDEYVKEFNRGLQASNISNWDDQFGEVADLIDSDFNELKDSLPEYLDETRVRMQEAGFDEASIEKKLGNYERDAVEIAFHALNRQDPESAERFASENANLLGKKVVGLKNQARRAYAATQRELQKAQIEEAKAGFRGLNADQIAEMESEKGPIGEAARETSRSIAEAPFKLLGKNPTPLNANDPESLLDRVAEVEEAEEAYSTPNRPVEIPYLDKANIKALKARMAKSPDHAQRTMDFLTSVGPAELEKMARSFGEDPIGHAARVYAHDPALALKIIEGTNSLNKPEETVADLAAQRFFNDPAANNSAIRAMSALSKVDPDAVDKAVNMQDITPGLFNFETLIPVPHGFSGKRFKVVMEDLLSDPARVRKYANGEMAGGDTEIDYDDVEFEAQSPGIYLLKKDGKYLVTEDGDKYAINARRVLEDGQ